MIAILRYIFIFCVLFVISRLFQWLSGLSAGSQRGPRGMPRRNSSPIETNRGKMVKDPMCGTYVDPALAVSLVRGGERLFFCSKECQDQYEGKRAGSASG
jgi:YHS domain-containing protein